MTVCFRILEKASEETAVDTQRLIQWPDNDVQDEIIKTRRTKSADLLKKELEKHGKSGSREYLSKVAFYHESKITLSHMQMHFNTAEHLCLTRSISHFSTLFNKCALIF